MNRAISLTAVLLSVVTVTAIQAKDWPTYRADAERSGYTSESLPSDLSLRWVREASHAPMPAWEGRDTRMPFDHAYHTAIADGTLFYGSSADGCVYALDAETGKERWSFLTDGPVRFAPAVWQGKAFAVSDDGYLYCLSAKTGDLLWKKRGGPDARMFLGNDRMISRWPARGGVAIRDGLVYFSAGIWPSEGIYLYALDADTGEERWCNDGAGGIEMNQPHGGARAVSGLSSQGYLAASDNRLYVPTGRAVPAALNRADGAFEYFHLQAYSPLGGTSIVAAGDYFFNSGWAFEAQKGTRVSNTRGKQFATFPGSVLISKAQKVGAHPWRIGAYAWADAEKKDKKGNTVKYEELKEEWVVESPQAGTSMIVANRTVISGGERTVCAVDMDTKEVVWKTDVDGTPLGLAVADGRLYVSTDTGSIYCFDSEATPVPKRLRTKIAASPYGKNSAYAAAAAAILARSGVREGYCLDLGCGDGALAYELAKRTNLKIYAIDSDPAKVRQARKKLRAAGLYGVSVTVHQADPSATDYPDYFADLVVSGRSVRQGPDAALAAEMDRMQRPYGGVVCVGQPDSLQFERRGALEGAAEWTHQYADTANTANSGDSRIRGPLRMLWYRDTDIDMPQRHGRGPAPLFRDGRMFVEGLNTLRAVDAYNGRTLWEYHLEGVLTAYDQDHLMGTAGTGSNVCIDESGVYVHVKSRCLRLDAATGKKIGEYPTPKQPDGKPGTWGYIACSDGTLYGSLANTQHIVRWRYLKGDMQTQYSESMQLFALDIETGKQKWSYTPQQSIRHNTIALADGRLFLIDRSIADIDKIDVEKGKRRGADGKEVAVSADHTPGKLLALDAESGAPLWESDKDIYGTMLAASVEHDILLMTYQPTRFRLKSEIGGRMTAFRASTGNRLWDNNREDDPQHEYASRPIVNGGTIYAQPGAWDLATGRKLDFAFSRSYGCGTLASAENLLVYRSATLGYRDIEKDTETQNYGGIRSGCWINAIPAGGLVLLPDAASGCVCSYLIKATIALQEDRE